MRAILVCLLFVSVALAAPEGYTTKWDNVNVEEILHNDRLLQKYVDCLLDEKNDRCTPDGKELKEIIHDALQTECAKCNEKQKKEVKKVIKFLVDEKRPIFDKLAAKFDPKGVFLSKYKAEAEKEGIKL